MLCFNDLPTEILLMIFDNLTASEKVKARSVSSRWNNVIGMSRIDSSDLQFTVDKRSLGYYGESVEEVLMKFSESELVVRNLKLGNINIEYLTSLCFMEICQSLLVLTVHEVRIDESELYYCLNELRNLQNLSVLNCKIDEVPNQKVIFDGLLPNLKEIQVDFQKTQREDQYMWDRHILENFIRTNNAELTLKIRVMFHDDHEEANYIIRSRHQLKNLQIEILQPSVLSRIFQNYGINLNELTIDGSLSLHYRWYIRDIILTQRNLRKLFIHPKMQDFSIVSIEEIQQNLVHLKYFAFSTGDQYADDDIRRNIHFDDNLKHLDLKYHDTGLSFVFADHLKELVVHPYVIRQREIDMIVEKFRYLTKLSFHINGENNTLTFVTCFKRLKHLENLEIINVSEEHQLNIVLFDNPSNMINILRKLKKLNIINVNVIDPDELKLIYRICPNIEELGLVRCRLSVVDLLDVLQLVALGLKKLKKICYTHEYNQWKAVPHSARWFVDNCPALQRIEFVPEVTLDGSYDVVFEAFYYSLSSIIRIKQFFDDFFPDRHIVF